MLFYLVWLYMLFYWSVLVQPQHLQQLPLPPSTSKVILTSLRSRASHTPILSRTSFFKELILKIRSLKKHKVLVLLCVHCVHLKATRALNLYQLIVNMMSIIGSQYNIIGSKNMVIGPNKFTIINQFKTRFWI